MPKYPHGTLDMIQSRGGSPVCGAFSKKWTKQQRKEAFALAKSVLKRALLLVGTLLLITVLAFIAFQIVPGDPTDSILGLEATEDQIATLRTKLGLDLPVWQRYWNWLSAFVTGDFGSSYNYSMPVAELLASRMGVTFTLASMAFALIVAISIPLGIIAARYEGGIVDRTATILTQLSMSIPNFILGIGLFYVFSLVLHWFRPEYVPPDQGLGAHLWYMVFPALAAALPKSAMAMKLLRGSILGEMGQDYIRTAYSKGNSKSSALWRHVLRNAMIPVVTFLAMAIADIAAASIVIERVFGIPGLGQMLITSINNRDYPVVQAIVVLVAAIVVSCNFLADLLYRVMDPRIEGR